MTYYSNMDGWSFRVSNVDFIRLKAEIDGEEVQLETPDADVYGVGYMQIEKKAYRFKYKDGEVTDEESIFRDGSVKPTWPIIRENIESKKTIAEDKIIFEDDEIALIDHAFQSFVSNGCSIPESVKAYAIAGQKIQAIKQYRILTGCGLKESKHHVDRYMESLR